MDHNTKLRDRAASVVLAVVGIILLQPLRPAWDQQREPAAGWISSPLSGVRLVLRPGPLRYLCLVGMCFSCVQLSLSAFTVTVLVEEIHLNLLQAGLILSALQLSGVAGRMLWGWVADLNGSGTFTLALIGSVTVAAAVAASLMTPGWPLAVVVTVYCLFGSAALGWNGVYLAEVARHAPFGRVGDASGGCLFFTYAGVVLGLPAFVGLHGLLGSYTLAFGVIAAVALVGLGFVLLARRAIVPVS